VNVRAALIVALCIVVSGCEKHMQDMYDQPRYKPLASSSLFPDGGASRHAVSGTQVHASGDFAGTSSGTVGSANAEQWERDEQASDNPYPVTLELLQRGRERFNIYCAPCHSAVGDGDGFIVRRGFPAPPSLHNDRLRAAPDRHFFDVITQGYGIMYSHADRVTPADRWAITAYIRALQLSQHAQITRMNGDDLAQVQQAAR
jgi:mono/diheme cytochrome c family protein